MITGVARMTLTNTATAWDNTGTRDTLVIATHRPAAIPYASRIIVMQQGRIVADGERDRVLAALRSKVAA